MRPAVGDRSPVSERSQQHQQDAAGGRSSAQYTAVQGDDTCGLPRAYVGTQYYIDVIVGTGRDGYVRVTCALAATAIILLLVCPWEACFGSFLLRVHCIYICIYKLVKEQVHYVIKTLYVPNIFFWGGASFTHTDKQTHTILVSTLNEKKRVYTFTLIITKYAGISK